MAVEENDCFVVVLLLFLSFCIVFLFWSLSVVVMVVASCCGGGGGGGGGGGAGGAGGGGTGQRGHQHHCSQHGQKHVHAEPRSREKVCPPGLRNMSCRNKVPTAAETLRELGS